MKISEEFREQIAEEFEYAHQKMSAEQSPLRKLYWFTGSYSMAQRIMNLEYDDDLLFLFVVCQLAYERIQGRLATASRGADLGAGLPDDILMHLESMVAELGVAIKANADLTPMLKRMAVLGYSATGNGYYLWSREKLSLGGAL